MRTQIEDVRDEAHIGWFQEQPSLRDRFAMAAVQGFCSQCDATGMWSWQSKDAVAFAYEIADAMMEARK